MVMPTPFSNVVVVVYVLMMKVMILMKMVVVISRPRRHVIEFLLLFFIHWIAIVVNVHQLLPMSLFFILMMSSSSQQIIHVWVQQLMSPLKFWFIVLLLLWVVIGLLLVIGRGESVLLFMWRGLCVIVIEVKYFSEVISKQWCSSLLCWLKSETVRGKPHIINCRHTCHLLISCALP